MCGLPVAEVDDDGSPRGERLFALWNPPLTDERSGARASSNGIYREAIWRCAQTTRGGNPLATALVPTGTEQARVGVRDKMVDLLNCRSYIRNLVRDVNEALA